MVVIQRLPLCLLLSAILTAPVRAQQAPVSRPDGGAAATPVETSTTPQAPLTMWPHDGSQPWWISGQLNVIGQAHGAFRSSYQGTNSLKSAGEDAVSRVWTLDLGYRVSQKIEVLVDVESAGGRGISDALGLAGFTNLDVVRNPTLGSRPYLARAMVHITLPLGNGAVPTQPSPLSSASATPARRLELRVGKMSLADFFDTNGPASDSHLQFANWTIDNTGAYDYAADTRGYTYAVMAEYDAPRWSLLGAEALMPTVANGIDLDWDIARARSDNLELDLRPRKDTTIRVLAYANHANMGSYADAIQAFEDGVDPTPNVEAHRQQGRLKDGVVANTDYAARHGLRLFIRTGWNEGANESFAYTEVNSTIALGGDVKGTAWRRPDDKVGVAWVSSGISAVHQDYLRLGGLGFLLGDGTLRYGRERIVEAYYTAHLWRGAFASIDGQSIENPGYNRDRGPVLVSGLRLHVDF